MLTLGIETSCDETGVALYDSERGVLGEALHSQVDLHALYDGVVPELASRDHIRRIVPLAREALGRAGRGLADVDLIAYTEGPGLAGALLVGASVAAGLGIALGRTFGTIAGRNPRLCREPVNSACGPYLAPRSLETPAAAGLPAVRALRGAAPQDLPPVDALSSPRRSARTYE